MEGGLESSSARVEELGGVFSIWRFHNILMKISAALRCYRFVGYFHSGLDLEVCPSKQTHMVKSVWSGQNCLPKACQDVAKCCL